MDFLSCGSFWKRTKFDKLLNMEWSPKADNKVLFEATIGVYEVAESQKREGNITRDYGCQNYLIEMALMSSLREKCHKDS